MHTPDYNCESYTGFEIATCEYYQDLAITHYYAVGYFEIILVCFLIYVILYKVVWRVIKNFFVFK